MSAGNLLRRFGGPVLAFAVLASTAGAQSTQTPTSPPATGGGSSTPTTPTTPTRPSTPTTPTTPQQQPSTMDRQTMPDRPIFLSGRVIMEDGTAPSESVTIERVCGGNARPEAHTDGKGYFHFQLGENMHVFADASVSSAADQGFGGSRNSSSGSNPFGGRNISERELMNCEIRANLSGYRSTVVSLAGHRSMDNPEIGTIILHPMVKVEGMTVSATTAMAPKDAKKAFEKGREALKKNKLPEAQKELEKATSLYPKFATAWYTLGLAREQQKDVDGAKEAYAQALAADSKYVNPYLQLAQIAAAENKWQDVADTTDRLLKLNPFDFPRAWFINAVANYNLKNMDAAEQSARTAAKNDPDNHMPKVHHLLGVILAQKQEYPAAAVEMRSYLKLVPNATDADLVKKQLLDIDKITGKQETAEKK